MNRLKRDVKIASHDGGVDEVDKAASGLCDAKMSPLNLLTATLADMSQMDEQAQKQTFMLDEQARRARNQAREQAQMDQQDRSDEQARHLVEVLQAILSSLGEETEQYTDQAYDSAKSELLAEV